MTNEEYFEKNSFGEVLFAILEGSMTSQYRFAKEVGVSAQTVNCWINGTKKPSIRMLRTICVKTGISADILLRLK